MTFYRLLGWSCINLTWTVALYNARLDDIPGREGGKKGIFIHQKKKKLQKKKRERKSMVQLDISFIMILNKQC